MQNLLDELYLLTDVLGIIVIKEEEMLDSEIEEMIEKRQVQGKIMCFCSGRSDQRRALAKGLFLKIRERK